MQRKLTLRLDSELIERAKQYAKRQGTSVSQLVADYFRAVTDLSSEAASEEGWKHELGPVTRSLVGLMAGSTLDEDDYYRHLEAKHLSGDTSTSSS